MKTGVIAIVLTGTAMPAELRDYGVLGETTFRADGPVVPVSEIPATARVIRNVDFHDPGGSGKGPYNMLACDEASGKAWYVYCRAGHVLMREGGYPIQFG